VDQDDPQKRIADRERQLAEPAKQTPDSKRREEKKAFRLARIILALMFTVAAGACVIDYGLKEEGAPPGVVWLGVAMLVLSVLIPVAFVIKAIANNKKDRALRVPGTVELLTVESSYSEDRRFSDFNRWELRSEMQIRLDSGHTFRGLYFTSPDPWQWEKWWRRAFPPEAGRLARPFKTGRESIEAIFPVGASMQCRYNPTNPDRVVVFPFAARGDRVKYNEHRAYGSDYVWFKSAT
jgi:hypothetical protein